jgi:hypothetical protein
VILLSPGRDACEQCRSSVERAGYWIVVGDDPGDKKQFLCSHHVQSALREGLVPRRVISSVS